MKINQWTLGLAAVGVISLASAVNAEEGQMNALQTALSSTTISGYVDTSVEWTLGRKDSNYGIQSSIPFRDGKQDGFNLNVVKLTIEKPLDESEWASGYKVDLLFGPDANGLYTASPNTGDVGFESADFAIKQAYVALRTPVGNGIDWKVGVFDTIIGYETFEAGNNPNFTRSWGYYSEPTQHTGILGTYRVSDNIAVAAGVANTINANINDRASFYQPGETWHKTYMASIAVTAPDSCGFLSGSTLYGGVVGGFNGFTGSGNNDQVNYYSGATLNTPVAGLKAGVAFDYVYNIGGGTDEGWILGGYASYQATEKLSLHARGEYGKVEGLTDVAGSSKGNIMSLTGTVQYDLWQNVISRLEVRWDQAYDKNGLYVNNNESLSTADTGVSVYANFIYKF